MPTKVDSGAEMLAVAVNAWFYPIMGTGQGGLYVADIRRKYKDREYVTHLVRRVYREAGKVKQKTLANITHLPPEAIELVRQALKGTTFVPLAEGIKVIRTRYHGHVAAVRAMLRKLGLHELIARRPSRLRDLCEAIIVARIVDAQLKISINGHEKAATLAT